MYCSQVVAVVYILTAFNTNPNVNADKFITEDATQFFRLLKEDNIVILDGKNLTSNIYNSDKSWAVGYFGTNDEVSTNFMTTLKRVAYTLRILNDINIATINCTQENTLQNACTMQNVTSYPTFKYYPPNAENNSLGTQMEIVNHLQTLAHNIFKLMNKYEKPGNNISHQNIQHLVRLKDQNQSGETVNASNKNIAWQNNSIYVICVFTGFIMLTIILWLSYNIFKRLSKREVNVYTVLHKSETNDDDSIQVRLKY